MSDINTIDFCATNTDTDTEETTLPTGEQVDLETGEVTTGRDLTSLASCVAVCCDMMGPLPVVRPGEYPYHGKKAVQTKLRSCPEFAMTAFVTMFQLQTEYEQAAHTTKDKNRRGLMSSHAGANGKHNYSSDLISSGGSLSCLDEEGQERVVRWGSMYTKQLSALLRQAAGPELAASSSAFFS